MKPREVPRIIAKYDGAALIVDPKQPGFPAPIDRYEIAWVIALSAADEVRACQRVGQGGHSGVDVPLPVVLSVPLLAHVDRFVLVHSHPAGTLIVSEPDKALTRTVLTAATDCGLSLVDHVIVTPSGDAVSLVAMGILEAEYRPSMPRAAAHD